MQFRIRRLKKQKIGQSFLSAGPHYKVGVGDKSVVQLPSDVFHGRDTRSAHLGAGVGNVVLSAVINQQIDADFVKVRRFLFYFDNFPKQSVGQSVTPARHHNTRFVAAKHLKAVDVAVGKVKQPVNFLFVAFPVFRTEHVQRNVLYTQRKAGVYCALGCIQTAAMPLNSGQPASLCPATVSVHDKGNVGYGIVHCTANK